MEVILDTNFIISCIKRKMDFISQLEEEGFKVLLPIEVFQELKDVRLNVSHSDRAVVDTALKIFDSKKVKKTTLGKGKIDKMLIEKGKKGFYIASLDAQIKRSVPNRVVISSSQNSILVERD